MDKIESSDQPVQGRWTMNKNRIQRQNCDLWTDYQANPAEMQ